MVRTLADVLRTHAERHGGDVGIGFRRDGDLRTWTWAEYRHEAERAATGLRAIGVESGDHVLMLVAEVEAASALVLGAWIIGAVPIQVGTPYRLTDVGAFLVELASTAERLRARLLVVSENLVSESPSIAGLRIVTAEAVRTHDPRPETLTGPNDERAVALIQLTSGSTGRPRGAVIGHDALLLHMESMSRVLVLSLQARRAVSWLPLHHDMGLIGGLLFPLYNDFPVYLLSPLDFRSRPFSWLEALSTFRAGITAAPPSAYAICIRLKERAAEAKLDLSALECAMIGAEPISARLLRAFSEALSPCGFRPEAFFPVYGLAEATVAVTFPKLLAPASVDVVNRRTLERDGRAARVGNDAEAIECVGVGSAIPNSEVRIVGPEADVRGDALPLLAPASDRTVGEIQVRSRTGMRCYFDDPDTTRAVFTADGWLRTGDLGYFADGLLFVTGRKKDLIIKGGHNVAPQAIEEPVSEVDGIRPGCVAAVGIYVEERETEEVWVLAETKLEASEHRALAHRIRVRLKARGITVDQIRLVEPGTLPKTTSGKLERVRVKQELMNSLTTKR